MLLENLHSNGKKEKTRQTPQEHSALKPIITTKSARSISVLSRLVLIAAGTDRTPFSAFFLFIWIVEAALSLFSTERVMLSELELILGSACARLWGSLERFAAAERLQQRAGV